MTGSYVAIPADQYGWLAATVNLRHELREAAALGVIILQAAGAQAGDGHG